MREGLECRERPSSPPFFPHDHAGCSFPLRVHGATEIGLKMPPAYFFLFRGDLRITPTLVQLAISSPSLFFFFFPGASNPDDDGMNGERVTFPSCSLSPHWPSCRHSCLNPPFFFSPWQAEVDHRGLKILHFLFLVPAQFRTAGLSFPPPFFPGCRRSGVKLMAGIAQPLPFSPLFYSRRDKR